MKRKASILVYTLLIGLIFSISYSCDKDDPKNVAVLTTTDVTNITQTTATSRGNISNDGGAPIMTRGICWSTNETPTINDRKTTNGTGKGSFTSNITYLVPNTTYHIRAFATNSVGTSYGKVITFKTLEELKLPTLTTTEVIDVTQTSVSSGGNISDDGGAPINLRGVCWSISELPTIYNSKSEDGEGAGSFSSNIADLAPNTTYYLRAYATNSVGTNYGDTVSFKTLEELKLPTLTTTEATKTTLTTATSGGNITGDGGAKITARGVCWSIKEIPTIDDSKTEDGEGTGSFISNIKNLAPNTTYYIRSYATNSVGTKYGNTVTLKTLQELELPILATTEAIKITQTTATSGGNISDDGGSPITARGICWSTKETPTIDDSKTEDGEGTGSFISNIKNLAPNTIYYIRSYATNSYGTSYGNIISFKTLKEIELPTLATTEATKVTQTTAISGGNISDDGGSPITVRGVCWSTKEIPTINDSKTMNGTGKGSFTSNVADLKPNITYYIRSYATNSVGTKYGNTVSFKTLQELELPTLATTKATKITQTTATSGGNISDDGGSPITARGVCWSTKETPTINDSKTTDGTGKGSYTSNMADLEPKTTYYIRAYATNSVGTCYGNAVSLTTKNNEGNIVDADGNVYQIVTIGTQTWMVENLKSTKYKDGTVIPLVTDNNAWGALSAPAYCWFDNDEATHKDTYGALYNWHTVKTGKICPDGWHVPTDTEWTTLTNYLGGNLVAGGKLKETGSEHWAKPNKGATNETYFTALPGGFRDIDGTFPNIKLSGHWWSSTEYSNTNSWVRDIFYIEPYITRYDSNKQQGCSVRCVKDL